MNTHNKGFVAALVISFLGFAAIGLADDLRREPPVKAPAASANTQTVTVVVTIVKLDVPAHAISVRDANQKVWSFVVDPKSGIDLRQYKVGDTVTATIATTTEKPTNPQLRARISKQDLIKLQ